MTTVTAIFQVDSGAWVDLGVGPMLVQATAYPVNIAVADTSPAIGDVGFALGTQVPFAVQRSARVWARMLGSVVSGAFPVIVAPLDGAAGGSGSGGAVTAADGALATAGATTDAAYTGTGGGTLVGVLKGLFNSFPSLVATAAGKASRVVLVDPASGSGSLVQAFHNSDNQAIGNTSYGLFTGGVDQLLNAAGNLDRKRAVSGDGMVVTGIAAEVPMLFNGTGYDRARGDIANGLWVNVKARPGSNGGDASANKPALPAVGAAFAASGPYAGYVVVATVPANASRANIDIENISGAPIAIVRDDGTALPGTAPANASVFALSGGAGSGLQGGAWSSRTFRGRLQIYAASSSAIVTVMQD